MSSVQNGINQAGKSVVDYFKTSNKNFNEMNRTAQVKLVALAALAGIVAFAIFGLTVNPIAGIVIAGVVTTATLIKLSHDIGVFNKIINRFFSYMKEEL